MKVYNVANKDGTAFYSSGYSSRFEAEELLKISKQHDPDAHVVEYKAKTELEKMAEERAELLARIPRWISVEERLPEEGQIVAFLPSCNHGSVYVGVLASIGKSGGVMFSHREGRYKSNYYAKYWMPLPEPPKEEVTHA